MSIITLRRRTAHWGGDHGGFADRIPRSAILLLTPLRARTYRSSVHTQTLSRYNRIYSGVIRGIMPVLHVWRRWIIATRPHISATGPGEQSFRLIFQCDSSNCEKGTESRSIAISRGVVDSGVRIVASVSRVNWSLNELEPASRRGLYQSCHLGTFYLDFLRAATIRDANVETLVCQQTYFTNQTICDSKILISKIMFISSLQLWDNCRINASNLNLSWSTR